MNSLPSLIEISEDINTPCEKISKTLSTAAGSVIIPQELNGDTRQSPPKAIVDSSPLQSAMDKNRECKLLS